jgi:hypothetical protein
MLQRATDSAVLAAVSVIYSCAVLLLKLRTKTPAQAAVSVSMRQLTSKT